MRKLIIIVAISIVLVTQGFGQLPNKFVIEEEVLSFGGDTWEVNFYNTTIDKRLLIFIPTYKTHRDNQSK